MYRNQTSWLLGCAWCTLQLLGCQRDHASSATDPEIAIAKKDWQAEEQMLVAGEKAADCPAMATAMRGVFEVHRNDLLAAHHQLTSPDTIKHVTDYIEAHPTEFPDLDERWQAVVDRCGSDSAVQAILREKDHFDPTPAPLP